MSTITITFCETAENHKGMQMIGDMMDQGLSVDDLKQIQERFIEYGADTQLFNLVTHVADYVNENNAFFLIIRDGVKYLTADKCDELFNQLTHLEWDTKAFMYGRVVNKHARHNLCFADFDQEPDYETKKGRVINFIHVPILNELRENLSEILPINFDNLVAEGNYYYDITKCGIGFHGDTERKIVIGVRLGETIPIVFQWFNNHKKIGEPIVFNIQNGDIYFMTQKTTGNDWKQGKIPTLRHAAGCDKFIK